MADVLLSDIDGTLVDSNTLHAEAWRRTFEHFGIEIGKDDAWRQIGKGGDQVIPIFVPEADRERLEKPIKEFRKELFHRDYMSRIVAFAQVRDLLLRAKQSGMKIVLATSSEKEDLPTLCKIVGMEDLIDAASTSADAQASKPEADIFAAALKKVTCSHNKRSPLETPRGTRRQQESWGFRPLGSPAGVGNVATLGMLAALRSGKTRPIFCSISTNPRYAADLNFASESPLCSGIVILLQI